VSGDLDGRRAGIATRPVPWPADPGARHRPVGAEPRLASLILLRTGVLFFAGWPCAASTAGPARLRQAMAFVSNAQDAEDMGPPGSNLFSRDNYSEAMAEKFGVQTLSDFIFMLKGYFSV